MARLRRDTQETITPSLAQRPLRAIACGTLFLTHTLTIPTHPEPSAVIRAHSVSRSRGGSASTCLSILAQFPGVEAMLVAPLGGNEEGRIIMRDLEKERVSTRFCKVWDNAGVPSAWVLHADDTDSRTVINNNPLPDITHEEFVSLLGPILAPENYAYLATAPSAPIIPNSLGSSSGPSPSRPSISSSGHSSSALRTTSSSPAPMDWLHFEGRSVKTTLSNILGLDGLARERKWRSHCVFSLDVGKRARQGVEALIPHVDVVFLNKHYARAHSPEYASSPRAFLLSFTSIAPPHALLVAHWGSEGAALLSVPTKEYFQSSGWVEPIISQPVPPSSTPGSFPTGPRTPSRGEVLSVRTGSDFWAGHHTESSGEFTAAMMSSTSTPLSSPGPRTTFLTANRRRHAHQSSDSDSEGTEIAARPVASAQPRRPQNQSTDSVDEVGAQEAFVAGMIYALSRCTVPGEPYTPSAATRDISGNTSIRGADDTRGSDKWRLEECLKFATELAGRKARKKGWDGLADEMSKTGWFDV